MGRVIDVSNNTEQVIYNHPENGTDHDQMKCGLYLRVGEYYDVSRVEIDNWYTTVWLEEFPTIPFNSVMFDAVPIP